MNSRTKPTITIIGAGIAGCYTAILLAKRGYKVEIYEHDSKNDIFHSTSKRSFTLTFLSYGVTALKQAGVWDALQPHLNLLDGSVNQVTKYTKPRFSHFIKDDMPYYAVKRNKLMQVLIEQALTYKEITFHFSTALLYIDKYGKKMIVQDVHSKKIRTVSTDIILGADGSNSLVRSLIQQRQQAKHTQEYGAWSYKQIVIEKNIAKKLGLHANAMHSWTRKDATLVAFPNDDGSFDAIMILPKKAGQGFSSLTTDKTITDFVTKQFPAMLPLIPALKNSILHNPEGSFVMIHTSPWYYKDFITILGDAAHGFFPFFGQGISAAFGDGLALVGLLDQHGGDWNKILPLYQKKRKRHMDAMGELSKAGIARYRRDKIADYHVVYDTLENILHNVFPKYFLPSIFIAIAKDPDNTDDYLERYAKQKKLLAACGFSIIAHILTGILFVGETLGNATKKGKHATLPS